jgi:hypothetical protein
MRRLFRKMNFFPRSLDYGENGRQRFFDRENRENSRKWLQSDGLNEVGDKFWRIKKFCGGKWQIKKFWKRKKNILLNFLKRKTTFFFTQSRENSRKSRKFAEMVKSDGLNEVREVRVFNKNCSPAKCADFSVKATFFPGHSIMEKTGVKDFLTESGGRRPALGQT